MLQQDEDCFFNNKVGDFVIATGKNYSIRDFLSLAFSEVGINNWQDYVGQDPRFMRPAEVDTLIGDYSKARDVLGWEPKTSLKEIVKKMLKNDIELHKKRV